MSTPTKDIFISYSRHDLEVAKGIKDDIERTTGVECWMDLDCIECGAQYEDVIVKAIDEAKVVIFFLSEHSMESKWTKDEVRYAIDEGKKVIPVSIDHTELRGWYRLKFGGIDTVDYKDPILRQKFMDNICRWTGRTVGEGGEEEGGNGKEQGGTKSGGGPTPKGRDVQKIIFYSFVGIQTLVYGGILASVVYMFRFGLITMPEGQWAHRYNVALTICLVGTMYATWCLFQKKRVAYYALCALDVLEIIFLCALARRITAYALQDHWTYTKYPYDLLDNLGRFIWTYGDVPAILFLLAILGTLHIGVMSFVIFEKFNGRSMWSLMK